MTLTNNLTAAAIQYINSIGGLAWRNNTGAFAGQYTTKAGETKGRFVRYGEKGSGDVFAIFRGRFYSIEIKTGRDKLTDDQKNWMWAINDRGGCAFEARSIDTVIETIKP